MDRQGVRWLVVGLCVVLLSAGQAWAQERRDVPRDRPRPPARGEKAEPRPNPRPEPRENPRPEPRPNPRPEPREGDADVGVFRLRYIPAVSIMEVLEQLRRAPNMREMLEQVPVAVNEPANAIVVIGPPRVLEVFERLVGDLDEPSEFHEHMREQERERHLQDLEWKAAIAEREADLRARLGRMGPRPGRPGGPEGPGPVEHVFGRLLSPPVIRELGLEGDQIDKIRDAANQLREKAAHLRERVGAALREMPPERRRQEGPAIAGKAREEGMRLAGELRERIGEILRPDQREKAARLRGGPGPERPEVPRRERLERPERRERPERPERPEARRPQESPPLGDPVAEMVGRVMAPPVREKLRLTDEQAERIHRIARELHRPVETLHERVARAIGEAPPERREAIARQIIPNAQRELAGIAEKLRMEIFQSLRPEQRGMLERILAGPGRPEREMDRPREERREERPRDADRDRPREERKERGERREPERPRDDRRP